VLAADAEHVQMVATLQLQIECIYGVLEEGGCSAATHTFFAGTFMPVFCFTSATTGGHCAAGVGV